MRYLILLLCSVMSIATAQEKTVEAMNEAALQLYKQDPQQALVLLNDALDKSKTISEKLYTKNNLAIVHRDVGEYKISEQLSAEVIATSTDSTLLGSSYTNLGAVQRKLGLYQASLENYLQALEIYQNTKVLNKEATVTNNIGMVYSMLSLNDKAVEYHLKAMKMFEKLEDKKGISEAYNNVAIIYANDGDLDKALNYFRYSLQIEKMLGDQKGIAESQNNVGAVLYYLGAIDSGLIYFKRSADLEKIIGNTAGVAASYNNIAQVLMEDKRTPEAKIYIDSAYVYARQSKTAEDIEAALLNYADYYELQKNPTQALSYHKQYASYRDSILKQSNMNRLQELEVKYQTEKKERDLSDARANLAETELEVKQKNYLILGSLVLALILGLLGYLFYNQQKLKNRQLQKEKELSVALAKIETQNRLQEQRLRISRDLHDNIGAQLTFIISSLDNLKYGFSDMGDKLKTKLSGISSFTSQTIYELRDTIWAMNKEDISFEDLQVRISNFMKNAKDASEHTQFKFEVAQEFDTAHTFTSVEGMNLYRIIQESVNNALKYANSENISVTFSEENEKLHLQIIDDGDGFNAAEIERGNGLNSINKRARDIGGSAVVNSQKGEGTTIKVFV